MPFGQSEYFEKSPRHRHFACLITDWQGMSKGLHRAGDGGPIARLGHYRWRIGMKTEARCRAYPTLDLCFDHSVSDRIDSVQDVWVNETENPADARTKLGRVEWSKDAHVQRLHFHKRFPPQCIVDRLTVSTKHINRMRVEKGSPSHTKYFKISSRHSMARNDGCNRSCSNRVRLIISDKYLS